MRADAVRAAVQAHWLHANAREWAAFEALLDPALQYDVPQTREYTDSREGYVEMFSTWPGDWRVTIRHLVCEDDKAVCVFDFVIGDTVETGISVIEFEGGRARRITEWWPASYEPPPRATPLLKRRG